MPAAAASLAAARAARWISGERIVADRARELRREQVLGALAFGAVGAACVLGITSPWALVCTAAIAVALDDRLGHDLGGVDRRLGVAAAHGLRRQHHRLEARPAHLVDRHRRNRMRQSGFDRRLARDVLAAAGGQYLAQDDFGDLLGCQARLREQRAYDRGAEVRRRHLGDGTAEFADARPQGACDDNVRHVGVAPWMFAAPKRRVIGHPAAS